MFQLADAPELINILMQLVDQFHVVTGSDMADQEILDKMDEVAVELSQGKLIPSSAIVPRVRRELMDSSSKDVLAKLRERASVSCWESVVEKVKIEIDRAQRIASSELALVEGFYVVFEAMTAKLTETQQVAKEKPLRTKDLAMLVAEETMRRFVFRK